MRIPIEHNPVTLADLEALFKLLTRIDGHPRDLDDIDTWTLAARSGRWTRAQLAAAMLTLNTAFHGFRVMPGHVAEQITADRDRIRTRWYCPDPPRELADRPEAELAWRRRVAADYTERAFFALANGQPLDDVPLVTNPEPPVAALADAKTRITAICAGMANRKAITATQDTTVPRLHTTRRVPPDPDRLATARAELDARRPAPAPADAAGAEP